METDPGLDLDGDIAMSAETLLLWWAAAYHTDTTDDPATMATTTTSNPIAKPFLPPCQQSP